MSARTCVARKEYGGFSSNIDLIDVLPPGLYEAVFEEKTGNSANPDLIAGDWIMTCEPRTLDDIRAIRAMRVPCAATWALPPRFRLLTQRS